MKICSTCDRTYSDDSFSFCLEDGTLLSVPYSAPNFEREIETVIKPRVFRPISYISKKVNIAIVNTAIIDEPVVAINIAQQFPYVRNADELYNCTRGLWRLSKARAEKGRYAFAVYKGEIKEVFEINYWESAKSDSSEFWVERKKMQGVEIDSTIHEGRYQFVGNVASDEIRNKFVGKRMPVLHSQNPIRYFNC